MPEGHDATIEVCNIMSFVLYTQILKQSVLKPASPGITLNGRNLANRPNGGTGGGNSCRLFVKCGKKYMHCQPEIRYILQKLIQKEKNNVQDKTTSPL